MLNMANTGFFVANTGLCKALFPSFCLVLFLYLQEISLSITNSFLYTIFFVLLGCNQALERQKEYFDCIRIERDELRDELADLKETMKRGEVC